MDSDSGEGEEKEIERELARASERRERGREKRRERERPVLEKIKQENCFDKNSNKSCDNDVTTISVLEIHSLLSHPKVTPDPRGWGVEASMSRTCRDFAYYLIIFYFRIFSSCVIIIHHY